MSVVLLTQVEPWLSGLYLFVTGCVGCCRVVVGVSGVGCCCRALPQVLSGVVSLKVCCTVRGGVRCCHRGPPPPTAKHRSIPRNTAKHHELPRTTVKGKHLLKLHRSFSHKAGISWLVVRGSKVSEGSSVE